MLASVDDSACMLVINAYIVVRMHNIVQHDVMTATHIYVFVDIYLSEQIATKDQSVV